MEIRFTRLLRRQETGGLKRTRRCKGSQAKTVQATIVVQIGGPQTHPMAFEGM